MILCDSFYFLFIGLFFSTNILPNNGLMVLSRVMQSTGARLLKFFSSITSLQGFLWAGASKACSLWVNFTAISSKTTKSTSWLKLLEVSVSISHTVQEGRGKKVKLGPPGAIWNQMKKVWQQSSLSSYFAMMCLYSILKPSTATSMICIFLFFYLIPLLYLSLLCALSPFFGAIENCYS